MSTHTSSSADEVLTSAAESGPQDPLDALLGQIVGGYFVLTDGQGSVSKWSEPAELLFGRPAQEILGQSFFGTLLDPALGPEAQSWKAFLEAGEAPTATGRVDVEAVHAEGRRFAIESEPQPWEGWRTAGTLVVFRPTEPTPWVQEELEARDFARAEQDADVEERLTS